MVPLSPQHRFALLPICGLLLACAPQSHELKLTEVRETAKRAIPMEVRDHDRFGLPEGMPVVGQPDAKSAATPAVEQATQADLAWNFSFTLPAEWRELAPTQFRNPNLSFGSDGAGQCYVTVLAGDGGGLAENINRWREQMGLEPASAEAVGALPEITLLGQPAKYLELRGNFSGMMGGGQIPNALMLGALGNSAGHAVFVKLVAPENVGEAQRGAFRTFVESLRRRQTGEHADHAGHNHAEPTPAAVAAQATPAFDMPPPNPGREQLAIKAPAGWQSRADQPMRAAGFNVPGTAGPADCGVFLLPGTAGGIEANINRWRNQMDQPPMNPGDLVGLPNVTLAGGEGKLVELTGTFTGMQGEPQADAMLLGAIRELDGQTLFVKLTGPAETVRAAREAFMRFCADLEWKGQP